MNNLIKTLGVAVVIAMPLMSTSAHAAASDDTLAACLARSTTPDDRIVLVDWIFTMVARHPSVAGMTSISDVQRTAINQKAGALFTRLLTNDCAAEVKQAYKAGGEGAIENAFSTLGESAMSQLMSDPNVQAAGNDIAPYVDNKKLNALLAQ